MSDVFSHPRRAQPAAARSLRFPRVAAFAAAGYLALATVDFAGEALRPALPRADEAPPAVRPVHQAAMTPGAPVFTAASLPGASFAPPADESVARGVASWYGRRFHGLPTASGEPFDMHAYTAAHRTLPFGTPVEVRNPRNGRAVVVRINDRGPHSRRRAIDLSYGAARALGIAARGTARVELRVLR